jgi:hypothetical protein
MLGLLKNDFWRASVWAGAEAAGEEQEEGGQEEEERAQVLSNAHK